MRPRAKNLHHHLLRIVDGENQHLGLGTKLQHLLGRLDPVQLRHGHIHDHHVRLQFLRHLDGVASVGSLPATSIAAALDQIPDPATNNLVIVGNQDAGFLLSHQAKP